MSTIASFGHWLKERRKALDLTQEALAQKASCAVVTLQKLEADQRRPSRQMAERLAQCLNVTLVQRSAFVQFARGATPSSLTAWENPLQPSGSLHLPATPFIGRDSELAEMHRLLVSNGIRLLTLLGPGGIGKTRLALEAAQQLTFSGGVYFVPLQPLTSPEFLVSSIAAALGFQFNSGNDPKQHLLDFLREKSCLLVLDNFEHLLDGAGLLSDILASAPAVRLLVTSRERLNLVEEWGMEVGGLAYPASEDDAGAERYSGVELFVQQAQRVTVTFRLSEASRGAVVRICRLVGGMPLGIELAASWVRALSCEAIADEIERSLDILEAPLRNIEPRHRTMRATFEPTWNRLTDDERNVFMKLSVFRGGFTREAAQVVAGASLCTLSVLVDKSLLRVSENGRYDIHELLRQYTTEKLLDVGQADDAARRHLNYFLKLAEAVEAHQYGYEQKAWLDRLDIEIDNIRVALAWSLGSRNAESGLHITVAMREFWEQRGPWQEGLAWSERLLAAEDISPSLRAKALYRAGELAGNGGVFERASALCLEALQLGRQIGDLSIIAWALSAYALWSQSPKGYSAATIPMMDESLALFRELDDPYGLSHTLRRRALIAVWEQDYAYARPLAEEALTRARAVGDKNAMAWSLKILGDVSIREGQDRSQTLALYEESLALFRELDDRSGIPTAVIVIARIEQMAGHEARAQALYQETLSALLEIRDNDWNHLRLSLAGLGAILNEHGKPEPAARILVAAKWLNKFDYPFFSAAEYDALVASLRSQLGEAGFAAASAEGKAMTWEQAAAYALEQASLLTEVLQSILLNEQPVVELLSSTLHIKQHKTRWK